MKCLIGHTGFVGKNLQTQMDFDKLFNSKNIEEIKSNKFNIIICCGIRAAKWLANKNPEEDWNNIKALIKCLQNVKTEKFIHISTTDVYSHKDSQANEDYDSSGDENHEYGRNRLLFEKFVKDQFPNHTIIRLPALFGLYLKKNVMFDLLNKMHLDKLNIKNYLQWYNLGNIKKDIDICLESNLKIANFCTEPIENKELVSLFELEIDFPEEKDFIKYDIKTKYDSLFSGKEGYMSTKEKVLEEIKHFIKHYDNGSLL